MSENELIRIEHLKRLALEPGDILVLMVEPPISDFVAESLRTTLTEQLPGHRVLVLGGGVQLAVMRRPVDPAPASYQCAVHGTDINAGSCPECEAAYEIGRQMSDEKG